MNKRQRISAWIIGYFICLIFFTTPDVLTAFQYNIPWIVIGGLLLYLFRDQKNAIKIMRKFLIFIILLGGCSYAQVSHQQIKYAASLVETVDGVNGYEAQVLAQDMIISKGLHDRLFTLKPLKVNKRYFWYENGQRREFVRPPSKEFQLEVLEIWEVLFRDRKGSFFHGFYPIIPFYVHIDAKSGEILKWGMKRDDV